jgi:biopolymer transport protein ExbD
MRRKIVHREEEAEINITPMLDVVFIMLIFFIVTTSFVSEIGVDVNRPSNQPPKDQKISEVIAVRIDKTGKIMIQGRTIDIRAVRANIESALAAKADAPVVIVADRESDAGLLVRVIDQARVAGAETVSIAAAAR